MGKFYPVVDEDGLETVLLILEALAKSEEAAIREKSIASITQLRYERRSNGPTLLYTQILTHNQASTY